MTEKRTAWRPTACRAGCIYAGVAHAGINECRYQEMMGMSRGCDPGKDCTQYRRRAPGEARLRSPEVMAGLVPERRPHKTRKCNWDNERGYRLFKLGLTSGQIAGELGTTAKAVQQRRRKYWNHGRA